MDRNALGDLLQLALQVTFDLSAPMLVAGLVVGLVVSIFQAATQIQEVTLVFIPKMIVVGLVMWYFGPAMVEDLTRLVNEITVHIHAISRGGL
jgi:flagellar biosynthetic protein FliQ